MVGFLFAACEANELILPTTKNLGNAFDKYGIVQIGCVVFKTEWSGETQLITGSVLLIKEAARGTTLSAGVMEALMMNVAEVVRRHLKMGDKVRLADFGLLKLEIESEKVDNLKDFRAKKLIRGVRLHFIPVSEGGSPTLYQDITYEKVKD